MKSRGRLWIVAAPVLVAAVAVWYFSSDGPKRSATPSEAPIPRVQALSWEEVRAGIGTMDALEISQHGLRFFQQGDPDHAFLMFKYAAKKGDAWSARAIGQMYDPATFAAEDFDPKRSAFSKPNPRKALKWYEQALERGDRDARALRDRLIASLREAARSGDAEAQAILRKVK